MLSSKPRIPQHCSSLSSASGEESTDSSSPSPFLGMSAAMQATLSPGTDSAETPADPCGDLDDGLSANQIQDFIQRVTDTVRDPDSPPDSLSSPTEDSPEEMKEEAGEAAGCVERGRHRVGREAGAGGTGGGSAEKRKRNRHILGPCKVCGTQATGYHYGVNTCEACKGFFRRSILRGGEYTCEKNAAKCAIRPDKPPRNLCPACRYQKCLDAGMSIDGIKIGRYTYVKKSNDIQQLKERQQRTKESAKVNECEKLIDTVRRAQQHSLRPIHDRLHTTFNDKCTLDAVQQTLIPEAESRPKELKDIPLESFVEHFHQTGVQIDNRLEVLDRWLSVLDEGLRTVVSFAKNIPGFKELDIGDQMKLIKNAACEIWIVSRHRAFHETSNVFTAVDGYTFDLTKALGDDFSHEVLGVARRLKALQLTDEEMYLLKALVIFTTDRCELSCPEKITVIQDQIFEALIFALNKHHPGEQTHMVCNIVTSLVAMRSVTEQYQQYAKKVVVVSQVGAVSVPPLFMEVLTNSQ